MKNQTDPVVQDLTEWINRSAGQHQRRMSEGTASARRLEKRPEQTDEEAANLKAFRASVIANGLLHRVDASQMGQRDGVSVGACRTDLHVDFAGPEPRAEDEMSPLFTVLAYLIVVVLLVAALFATAPELFWLVAGAI